MDLAVQAERMVGLPDLARVFPVAALRVVVEREVSPAVEDLAEAEAVVAAEVVEALAVVEADREVGVPGKPPARRSETGVARISRFMDRRPLRCRIRP